MSPPDHRGSFPTALSKPWRSLLRTSLHDGHDEPETSPRPSLSLPAPVSMPCALTTSWRSSHDRRHREQVQAEDAALALLSRSSDGSMPRCAFDHGPGHRLGSCQRWPPVLSALQIRELMGSVPNTIFEHMMSHRRGAERRPHGAFNVLPMRPQPVFPARQIFATSQYPDGQAGRRENRTAADLPRRARSRRAHRSSVQ